MMLHDNIMTSSLTLFYLLLHQYSIKAYNSTLNVYHAFIPRRLRHFTGIFFLNLTTSLRYCQTGDKFHSLIMWNTLVNIDVPFRKLLQSVFFSSHDVSQGVNQWCNVKFLAGPHVSWEERCVWQHTVVLEERKRQADYFVMYPFPSLHMSTQEILSSLHRRSCHSLGFPTPQHPKSELS